MTKKYEVNKVSPILSTDDVDEKFDSSKQDLQVEETFLETYTSCRWIMAYVGCICFIVVYTLRVNLSIAMVCMVKPLPVQIKNTSVSDVCAANEINNTNKRIIGGDIEWDKSLQGQILGSLFYGYILTQLLSGYLSGRFGGKRIMLTGMTIYGVATLLLPVAARYDGKDYRTSAYLVIALRIICGLSTGVTVPAMQNLLGKWCPKYERSKISVLVFSGMIIGSVLMLGFGGFFCEWEAFDGGWPGMFYMGGAFCLLFCVLWAFTVYDSPDEHPRITEKERQLILNSTGASKISKNKRVPWLKIVTSPCVWAIIVAHVAKNFGNYALVTKLPAFMKEVLRFDIKSNGLYSTLPYIATFIVANGASNVIDRLRQSGRVSTVHARKIAMALALVVPACLLIATSHVPCDMTYLGVIGITLAVGFTGFDRNGYMVNPQDIAPRFSGEVYGFSNTFATVPGMVAPIMINEMTPNGTTKEWQRVFYIWAAIYVFGAVFYGVFAKGEIQDWAEVDKSEEEGKPNDGYDVEERV